VDAQRLAGRDSEVLKEGFGGTRLSKPEQRFGQRELVRCDIGSPQDNAAKTADG